MKKRYLTKSNYIIIAALMACFVSPAPAAEKKPPITQYWMSAATENMSLPGMSAEEMSGFEGMILGKIAGTGPKKTLLLQLNSPKAVPAEPEATHDIPPGQKMGSTLPLIIPERDKPVRSDDEEEITYEKPKLRMLMYWGCSETVRPGQPRVLDTEKMSMAEFGKAMSGRTGSRKNAPSLRAGLAYAEWPNKKNRKEVPKNSSLQGEHFVHGNYTPDIKFAVGEKQDFMAPVEFSSVKGGLAESIGFQWKSIPSAIGYFAMSIGHNEKTGEMIIWSSSEVQEPGYGLMNYLAPADVTRLIKEKVIMPPDRTSCAIPKGIFRETGGSAVQFIGYGDELNIAHPPKPKDPKIPHEYIWAMKLRNKSTGMLPLGQEDGKKEQRSRGRQQDQEERPAETQKSKEGAEKDSGTLNKIRGILGF